MSKVWFVTGSASGLGRSIAEAVLASGYRLVATARDPLRLEGLVKEYGDQVRTAPLDVADEEAAFAAVSVALNKFGRPRPHERAAPHGDARCLRATAWEDWKALRRKIKGHLEDRRSTHDASLRRTRRAISSNQWHSFVLRL